MPRNTNIHANTGCRAKHFKAREICSAWRSSSQTSARSNKVQTVSAEETKRPQKKIGMPINSHASSSSYNRLQPSCVIFVNAHFLLIENVTERM